MSQEESRLFRHLAIAVMLKLLVLAVLWWMFVRDVRVNVDVEQAAAQMSGAASSQGQENDL